MIQVFPSALLICFLPNRGAYACQLELGNLLSECTFICRMVKGDCLYENPFVCKWEIIPVEEVVHVFFVFLCLFVFFARGGKYDEM